ncbi:MAG TPA: L-histidine N(alpha)-methyltransferase [Myxococcota bacterium]|nr:L-histidine N(alpha)-methyltransferase [Myxococcota bacterium]
MSLRLRRAVVPQENFRDEVLRGLARPRKMLPCKYFYDATGSALFDEICDLPEYYLTRDELGILRAHAPEMAALLGPRCLVIEYGSGSGVKTRLLLDQLVDPAGYVPIDISPGPLAAAAHALVAAYPTLEVLPVCADYTAEYPLPQPSATPARRGVFFPGSTIGNFTPGEAESFLKHVGQVCGRGGALLVGVDLAKGSKTLERAYDDSQGVTARFNLNLLARINRELGADFDLGAFRHRAVYERSLRRVEMHLVSKRAQEVRVAGTRFLFQAGEAILTECSYKWDLVEFEQLARGAGWRMARVWRDPQRRFSVQYLTAE